MESITMKGKLAAVAVALLLFATGAAMAMPGNAPDAAQADDNAQAADDRPDDPGENPSNAEDGDEETSENESDGEPEQGPPMDVPARATDEADGSQGPPADLPDAVPEFVSQVHDAIADHSGGSGLGDLVSDLTPDDDSENGDEGDAANATEAAVGVPAGL